MPPHSTDRLRLLHLVLSHSVDAVAFQGLAPSMLVWFDPSGGAVAYFDTGRAWVAAGGPVAPSERGAVAARFVAAAAAHGRRASFFAVEDLRGFSDWLALGLGDQPSASPSEWAETTRHRRSLREQLRRARAKGVHARLTPAGELARGSALRGAVDGLIARWVASHRIEPMGFIVTPDPYTVPEEHRYVVAARGDDVVGFLSAVPAYAGGGWLVEHMVSLHDAPNGTAESLLDALHRSLIADGRGDARVTQGLSPLSTASAWHVLARVLMRPLFDFEGLRRFKARLRPSEWRPVWLVSPHGSFRVVVLLDALAAFAGGSLVRFALRSLFLHTRGLLWLLALGLVPWTGLLLWLDVTRESGVAGYSTGALGGWIAFDVVLASGLFRMALRPGVAGLATLTLAAAVDAALSTTHLHAVGFGPTLPDAALRAAAALAPSVGAATLLLLALRQARVPAGLSQGRRRGTTRRSVPPS